MTDALKDWMKEFIRARDIFAKSIRSVSENKDGLVIKYEDRTVHAFCADDLKDIIAKASEGVILVVSNTKPNVDCLVQNWSSVVKYQDLVIYFVHPPDKWVIKPHLHDKIADEDNLEKGLYSLYESLKG